MSTVHKKSSKALGRRRAKARKRDGDRLPAMSDNERLLFCVQGTRETLGRAMGEAQELEALACMDSPQHGGFEAIAKSLRVTFKQIVAIEALLTSALDGAR